MLKILVTPPVTAEHNGCWKQPAARMRSGSTGMPERLMQRSCRR